MDSVPISRVLQDVMQEVIHFDLVWKRSEGCQTVLQREWHYDRLHAHVLQMKRDWQTAKECPLNTDDSDQFKTVEEHVMDRIAKFATYDCTLVREKPQAIARKPTPKRKADVILPETEREMPPTPPPVVPDVREQLEPLFAEVRAGLTAQAVEMSGISTRVDTALSVLESSQEQTETTATCLKAIERLQEDQADMFQMLQHQIVAQSQVLEGLVAQLSLQRQSSETISMKLEEITEKVERSVRPPSPPGPMPAYRPQTSSTDFLLRDLAGGPQIPLNPIGFGRKK